MSLALSCLAANAHIIFEGAALNNYVVGTKILKFQGKLAICKSHYRREAPMAKIRHWRFFAIVFVSPEMSRIHRFAAAQRAVLDISGDMKHQFNHLIQDTPF